MAATLPRGALSKLRLRPPRLTRPTLPRMRGADMRYRRPSRLRRVLKWAGLGLCLVILAAWGVSLRWTTSHQASSRHYVANVRLANGRFSCRVMTFDWPHGWPDCQLGVEVASATGGPLWGSRFGGKEWNPTHMHGLSRSRTAVVPVWIVLGLVAIPTAILWYRDRRPPKGCCQGCGYNLRGNVSGVCPECGEPI
jgi:hypothetical protein